MVMIFLQLHTVYNINTASLAWAVASVTLSAQYKNFISLPEEFNLE